MPGLTNQTFVLRRVLKIGGIVILVAVLVTYVSYQARNLLQGPSIVLLDADMPIQHEKIITLHGQTHNIVDLTLNGKEIHTDIHGTFSHELVLENGYTIVTLSAKDRFGRSTTLTREYVYVPTSPPEHGV